MIKNNEIKDKSFTKEWTSNSCKTSDNFNDDVGEDHQNQESKKKEMGQLIKGLPFCQHYQEFEEYLLHTKVVNQSQFLAHFYLICHFYYRRGGFHNNE